MESEILCLNYSTGIPIQGRIERVDVAIEDTLRETTFTNGDSFSCSPSQRLYNHATREWTRTYELSEGLRFPFPNSHELVIASVRGYRWDKKVYSFVVKPFDNFIVLAGKKSMLVAHDNSS